MWRETPPKSQLTTPPHTKESLNNFIKREKLCQQKEAREKREKRGRGKRDQRNKREREKRERKER